jgi:hypothetical protein
MSYAFINMNGNYMLELHDEIFINADPVAELERNAIIDLLKDSSKCRIDGGHDTKGYCFCEAINLIEERYHGTD